MKVFAGLKLIVINCVIAISLSDTSAKPAVVVTAPKVFLANTMEHVCLAFANVQTDGTVNISFYSEALEQVSLSSVTHTVVEGQPSCVSFPVPNVPISKGFLAVSVEFIHQEYRFTKRTEVHVSHHSALTIIQMDKPIYKPGQNVKFRILRLNSNLKPVLEEVPEIWIEDPSGIRIAQWLNVKTNDGLIDMNLDLSNEPTLGHWNIKIGIGSITETQKFEVKDYVLPKFDVKITSPPFILAYQLSATWKICAHYSYGKPVQGIVEVERRKIPSTRYCSFTPKIYFRGKIHGCLNVTGIIREDLQSRCSQNLKIAARVTEDGTGELIMTETEEIVYRQPLILDFTPNTPQYFRPGLPLHGKLLVMTPDQTPAPAEPIQLVVTAGSGRFNRKSLGAIDTVSDENGLISFTIGPMPAEVELLHVEAKSIRWLSEIKGKGHQEQLVIELPSDSVHIQPWYSPSGSRIQIDHVFDSVTCHNNHHFFVRVTERITDIVIHYQVMSSGNIIHRNTVNPQLDLISSLDYSSYPNSVVFTHDDSTSIAYYSFPIVIQISPLMFPVSRLLVFYIRPNGEVVSASMKFNVQICLNNQVKLYFNPEELMPAEHTVLHLEASAHSLCAVGVVDKAIHFLRGDNQFNLRKVESELSKFDIEEKSAPLQKSRRMCSGRTYDGNPFHFTGGSIDVGFNQGKRAIFLGPLTNYIDTIEAFDDTGVVVMSDLNLETRPCLLQYPESYPVMLSARLHANPVYEPYLTSAHKWEPQKPKAKMRKPKVEVRNYFPETWLWDLHKIGEIGSMETRHTIPHTITDWVGTAFCTSRLDGLGISPPATVRAFQPFFLTYTLPYSVKRGETVPVIVSVSNYLQECLPMKLSLEESKSFSIMSDSSMAKICICGDEIKTHRFVIRPKALGSINVTVYAYTTSQDLCADVNEMPVAKVQARDAISKPLLIKAEGFPKEQTWSSLICTELPDNTVQQDVGLFLPEALIVPDSARAFFSVVGDLLGPSLQGLDHLVQLPVGCGEQNMVLFAPNIFVMQYLNATGQLTPELKIKLISHMQTGYQRELTYKHDDGSYSAFGNSDREGSMWLTAFVVKTFAQAKPFIFIDENQVHQSMQWILSRQLENGCFPFWGRVLHKAMKGGLKISNSSYASITAYVLISLLEAGMPRTSKSVDDAFFCLKAESNPDVYTLVLSTYAAILADRVDLSHDLLAKLGDQATVKDNMLYWEMPGKNSPALDVELSAYAILCLTALGKTEHLAKAAKVIRWITNQRNSNGGFVSTQDTVVALQALAKFSSLQHGKEIHLQITLEADKLHHGFQVNTENKLLQQTVSIPQLPTVIKFKASGVGCALVQTVLRYNVEKSEGSDAFDLTVSTQTTGSSSASCRHHKVNICTRYKMEDGESNMVVVEAKMISGYEPDRKALSQVAADNSVKLKRWDINGDTLNMYFDKLTFRQKCFSFFINQAVDVSDVKPSAVKVYDYYQPELSIEVSYTIQGICTDDVLPSLSDDELLEIESGIIPNLEALDLPGNPTVNPSVPKIHLENDDQRVPVAEVIPPPVQVDLLGDESVQTEGSVSRSEPMVLKHFKDVEWNLHFPDGIEGPDGVLVHPPKAFTDDSNQTQDYSCPRCLPSPPENFKMLYCRSTFAFTAVIKSIQHSKMKMIHDMNKSLPRPTRKSVPIKYSIPKHCSCSFGESGGRILVVGSSSGFVVDDNLADEVELKLLEDTLVIAVPDKPLEPEFIRDTREKCAVE